MKTKNMIQMGDDQPSAEQEARLDKLESIFSIGTTVSKSVRSSSQEPKTIFYSITKDVVLGYGTSEFEALKAAGFKLVLIKPKEKYQIYICVVDAEN